jgi:hypothetical protein
VSDFSLAELEAIGSGQRAPAEAQRHQVEVVLGLLEMKRAGLFIRVHVHESKLAVELPREPDVKRSVNWGWAAKIVAEFHKREGIWDANTKPLAAPRRASNSPRSSAKKRAASAAWA